MSMRVNYGRGGGSTKVLNGELEHRGGGSGKIIIALGRGGGASKYDGRRNGGSQ